MADEKKLELLKKIRALAERGVGGEKEGAQRKLEELMEKYHVGEADLSDDIPEDFEFKYHNNFEKKLLNQTFYKVIGKDFLEQMFYYKCGEGSRSIIGIRCTRQQGIQIAIEYDFYRQLWEEEQEFFFVCFIQKHNIFATNPEDRLNKESNQMSIEEMTRMATAMRAMKDKAIVKRLGGESGYGQADAEG